MIGIAITAVQRLGDGVRWTAVRLACLESWLLGLQRDEQADCARDVWPGMRSVRGDAVDAAVQAFVDAHRAAPESVPWISGGYDEQPAHCVNCGHAGVVAESLCVDCGIDKYGVGGAA